MDISILLVILAGVQLGICIWVINGYLKLINSLITKITTNQLSNIDVDKPSIDDQDQYTPNEADRTIPLDQFEPDFSKPLVVKTKLVHKETNEGSSLEEVEEGD